MPAVPAERFREHREVRRRVPEIHADGRFGLVGAVRPQPYTDDEIRRVAASLWQPFVIEKTWIDAQERARRAGALDDLR